jgi:predicted secreted hydrolase
MKNRVALALALGGTMFAAGSVSWRLALPGYRYEFPRDNFNHPDFQTEWWYYTGNVHAADGRRFGFELTFFRQGVDRREHQPPDVWDIRDIWLAHFAFSDLDGDHFFYTERLNRSGPGIAGASLAESRVWNGNWQVEWHGDRQRLRGVAPRFAIDLSLISKKPPVIHGVDGISRKAPAPGHASHYISLTRLVTSGTVSVEGRSFSVDGLSWMDHEFFTHQLEPEQAGWDWLSLQFDDGSELMLFRLRRKDGSPDPYSSGTYIDRQGHTTHLVRADFSLTPGKLWKRYPIEWVIHVPSLGIQVNVKTRLPQQELLSKTPGMPSYWEGAIEIAGTRTGVGYLEMTGYE